MTSDGGRVCFFLYYIIILIIDNASLYEGFVSAAADIR